MGLFLVLVFSWFTPVGRGRAASVLRLHLRFGASNSRLGPCKPGSSPPASGALRPVFRRWAGWAPQLFGEILLQILLQMQR
jgi:hypothetical protein